MSDGGNPNDPSGGGIPPWGAPPPSSGAPGAPWANQPPPASPPWGAPPPGWSPSAVPLPPPRPTRPPPPSGPNIGLIVAVVVVLAIIGGSVAVYFATKKDGDDSKAAVDRTTTRVGTLPTDSSDPGSTTASSTPGSTAPAPREDEAMDPRPGVADLVRATPTSGDLDRLLPAPSTPGKWDRFSTLANLPGDPTFGVSTGCVGDSPALEANTMAQFERPSPTGILANVTVSIRRFSSAKEAARWLDAHAGPTVLACLRSSKGDLAVEASSEAVASDTATWGTRTAKEIDFHYRATSSGTACAFADDLRWVQQGRYVLSDEFNGCDPGVKPALQASVVAWTVGRLPAS